MKLRSRWESLLLSFYVPGMGQLAARRYVQGVFWLLAFPMGYIGMGWATLNPAFPTLLPVAIIGMVLVMLWVVMLVTAFLAVARTRDPKQNQPGIAGLLSAILPGLGQFYNGNWFIGVMFLVLLPLLFVLVTLLSMQPGPSAAAWAEWVSVLGGGAIYFWAVVGAVGSRQRANFGRTRWLGLLRCTVVMGLVLSETGAWLTKSMFQTFKIPTSSMQPTLYGETAHSEAAQDNGLWHAFTTGERPVHIRAKVSGTVERDRASNTGGGTLTIADTEHRIRAGLTVHVREGDSVTEGQVIASGVRKAGDYIVVHKRAYKHKAPQRGDIVVFSTDGIDHPNVRPESYYVNRVVGRPGERVSIDPPYVRIDGEPLKTPKIFDDISQGRRELGGYRAAHPLAYPPPLLTKDLDVITLGEDEYILLGDNSEHSLDGRYYGPVRGDQIIGRVVRVYWPFKRARVPE